MREWEEKQAERDAEAITDAHVGAPDGYRDGKGPEMNSSCGNIAHRTRPGELLRLVADGLTDSGLDVRLPERDGSCRLAIACGGARCTLAVNDWGDAEWDYCPGSGDHADPKQLADLATTLLTGRVGAFPRRGRGYDHEGITLKGVVGLELKARGLDVDLAVYSDEDYFDTCAEVVVTSPGSEDGAKVFVTDNGDLTWMREYCDEVATSVTEPTSCRSVTDPASIADAVVKTVTRAMSYLCPSKAA
jgi:hypothetical protein